MNQILKNHINQALSRFGYQMTRIPKIETNPQILGNYSEGVFIICNFCGTIFRRTSGFHSESLECPFCGAIARERVIYQCILYELNRRFSKSLLFFIQTGELKKPAHVGMFAPVQRSQKSHITRYNAAIHIY